MLALIPLVLLVATICGAFYYILSRRGLAAEERKNPESQRHISLLTETVGYVGAILVLAGVGVAAGQGWAGITDWGHVGIFASIAMFFLAIGLVVLWVADPAIQRMLGVVWFLSAGGAGAAAEIAAHDVYGTSGAVTALLTGLTITVYSAFLWLIRRRELQLVALFAGLTVTVSAAIITLTGTTAPWIAFALGLWALGIGWAITGWQYPQPLGTTVPLGIAIALLGPSFAVWDHPWVYAIAIATAATAMAASIPLRNTLLLTAGTLALFGYLTAAVVRDFRGSLGLPATLAICGVLLLALAVAMARVRRGARPKEAGHPERAPGTGAAPYEQAEQAEQAEQQDDQAEHGQPAEYESPHLHLPKAS
ncbi:MAG TPA: hypothetical protein VMU94_17070 [Streptosporangiaceae bacterium]|nr:hypothetical protein [Streptosporangiaceae bacterium]